MIDYLVSCFFVDAFGRQLVVVWFFVCVWRFGCLRFRLLVWFVSFLALPVALVCQIAAPDLQ